MIIIGQFHEGQLRDTSIQQKFANGDLYAGGHKSGVKYGMGQYCQKETAITYDGEWLNNEKHGKGEIIYNNEKGAKFNGNFEDDEIVSGEYKDPLGNIFKTMKPTVDEKMKIRKLV